MLPWLSPGKEQTDICHCAPKAKGYDTWAQMRIGSQLSIFRQGPVNSARAQTLTVLPQAGETVCKVLLTVTQRYVTWLFNTHTHTHTHTNWRKGFMKHSPLGCNLLFAYRVVLFQLKKNLTQYIYFATFPSFQWGQTHNLKITGRGVLWFSKGAQSNPGIKVRSSEQWTKRNILACTWSYFLNLAS